MNTRSALMLAALSCLSTAAGGLGTKAYQQSREEDRYQEPIPHSYAIVQPQENEQSSTANPAPTRATEHPPAAEKTIDDIVSPPVVVMEPINVTVQRSPPKKKESVRQPVYHQPEPQQLIQDTIAYTQRTGNCAFVARKLEHLLDVYCNGQFAHQFRMDLGFNPVADKLKQGDGATPEGRYKITAIKDIGHTDFYRAFLIDYPNGWDWREFREAKRSGRIPKDASIGGEVEIHGWGGLGRDWTLGCMALKDTEMDLLFEDYVKKGKVSKGTPVTIVQ